MKGVKELESKLLSMSSHSYDAIDKAMKKICKQKGITPQELHDNFKSAHNGQIPDEWIKTQVSQDNSEMDEQDFMCPDGKCGECPYCKKKKEMVSMGYSEDAVESIFVAFAEKYAEKKGLWANIHAKRKRIKAGSGERMRKPGEKGAPSAADLKASDTDGKKKK
jgi:hypothetical protein